MNERLATIVRAVDGSWGGEVLTVYDGKWHCMNVCWKETEAEARAFLYVDWPHHRIVDFEEFTKAWRAQFGLSGKAKLIGDKPKPGQRTYTAKQDPKTYSSKLEMLPGETPDTLVAPVAIAKRLGIPPQYVYQVIYKGRLKTVGERPKKVRLGDIASHYRKELVSE